MSCRWPLRVPWPSLTRQLLFGGDCAWFVAGPPNVGKSSLLNWLAGREAAIVSPVAGTTRDVVEATVVLAGVPVLLADTAGLRSVAADSVEEEGMRRTQRAVVDSDILVWVEASDGRSGPVGPRTPDLIVLNKIDLDEEQSRVVADNGERGRCR